MAINKELRDWSYGKGLYGLPLLRYLIDHYDSIQEAAENIMNNCGISNLEEIEVHRFIRAELLKIYDLEIGTLEEANLAAQYLGYEELTTLENEQLRDANFDQLFNYTIFTLPSPTELNSETILVYILKPFKRLVLFGEFEYYKTLVFEKRNIKRWFELLEEFMPSADEYFTSLAKEKGLIH